MGHNDAKQATVLSNVPVSQCQSWRGLVSLTVGFVRCAAGDASLPDVISGPLDFGVKWLIYLTDW